MHFFIHILQYFLLESYMDKMPVRTIHIHFSKYSPYLLPMDIHSHSIRIYFLIDLEGFLSLAKVVLSVLTVFSHVIESIMYRMVSRVMFFYSHISK